MSAEIPFDIEPIVQDVIRRRVEEVVEYGFLEPPHFVRFNWAREIRRDLTDFYKTTSREIHELPETGNSQTT